MMDWVLHKNSPLFDELKKGGLIWDVYFKIVEWVFLKSHFQPIYQNA